MPHKYAWRGERFAVIFAFNPMLGAVIETQRTALTVGVFIATFFVALTLGRLLKRRAGVHFGLLFQLFCLSVAFYAALAAAGVHNDWRNHLGSILILLTTAVVVALVDRYVWDFYFEKKKQTPILLKKGIEFILGQ